MHRLTALSVISSLSLIALAVGSQTAQAQTFSTIHAFAGQADGNQPYAGLTFDSAGNLYGTTAGDFPNQGTVFQLKRKDGSWVLNNHYPLGENPLGGVVFGPDGTLFGTTNEGGSENCQFGCGTVYNLRPSAACTGASCPWTETLLYSFTGGADGLYPYYVDLIFDQAGNLYGTTASGGSNDDGVVFKLTPSGGGWTESVIHNFNGSDGIFPASGVIFDSAGNLYGTTERGGTYGEGTVFRLAHSGPEWVLSTLYSFQGGTDGEHPVGGLIFDRLGNLYGTTTGGGGGSGSGGTVFELSPAGGGWIFNLLHGWSGPGSGGPWGNLAMDVAGNLYGAAYGDGVFESGLVFKLTPISGGWAYADLHDFAGFGPTWPIGGTYPFGGVTLDANGNVYGTTVLGGMAGVGNCHIGGADFGCGVVWEITP